MPDEPHLVLVLEDSPGRIAAIRRVLASTERELELCWLKTASEFEAFVRGERFGAVCLISLDHHLGPLTAGSGTDAALLLADRAPQAPVILHSSDSTSARGQEELLSAAGWKTERFIFAEGPWAQTCSQLL